MRSEYDVAAAVGFLAGHGRVLDRRRLDLLLGGGDAGAVLAALDGYRNRDGGYGWGIEPDLRSPESQQPDGGWTVDFEPSSPAAALEWRGYATVAAIATLRG